MTRPWKHFARDLTVTALVALGGCSTSPHPSNMGPSPDMALPTCKQRVSGDDAQIFASTLPATLACSATLAASVTVCNSGDTTWNAGDFKLGAVGDHDPLSSNNRIYLPPGASVPPGHSVRFTVPLSAPATACMYTTSWRMVHELVGWFGDVATSAVRVSCGGANCSTPADNTTLAGKLLMGYQGWFNAPGDGSPFDGWIHWFRDGQGDAAHATVDMWPDVSELGWDELYDTAMTLPDGHPARLFSSYRLPTVMRHFKWMQDNGIDGVWASRFVLPADDPRVAKQEDQVARNVRASAEAYGRVFAVELDISGTAAATLVDDVEATWKHLVDDLKVTASPLYLHHRGRPLVGIYGLGLVGRPGTPAQAQQLLDFWHAPGPYQATVLGGVASGWRTLEGDAATDPAWTPVYYGFDVISPWTVGRFVDDAGADAFAKSRIVPDLADTRAHGIDYMPVIWPGFSWHNLMMGMQPVNAIPRRGGAFYWRQAYNAVSAGSTMILNAMFDEVDEGTAMFPLAPSAATAPAQGAWVTLDADGVTLPSDWYLRLAGEATKMLRSGTANPTIPIKP